MGITYYKMLQYQAARHTAIMSNWCLHPYNLLTVQTTLTSYWSGYRNNADTLCRVVLHRTKLLNSRITSHRPNHQKVMQILHLKLQELQFQQRLQCTSWEIDLDPKYSQTK
jgi:hypothetical protein